MLKNRSTSSTFSAESQGDRNINVGSGERLVSAVGGGILALYGLSRRSLGGMALAAVGGTLLYRGATGSCAIYSAFDINTAHSKPVRIQKTVTINRPRQELYSFWRDLQNLPQFMQHIESIKILSPDRSEWHARMPTGVASVTWEAEITQDRPNERISWRSLPNSEVDNVGAVFFRELGDGMTEVEVDIVYQPPAGAVGQIAARLFNPVFTQMVKDDVRRFKQLLESRERPTMGQPMGKSPGPERSAGQPLM